ncbi:trypsin beta-like [Belonocnema kinseyi]|uniref:trypsin beta-like n=1 Tax=Belonocnema kinseyi TaxID=2817044 RepID=UPI00143D56DC|nr:trypsin beta-like [Belonocnema kinseyi]
MIQQVPYIVNLQKNKNNICGGSILSETVIITAAHCIEDQGKHRILSGSSYVSKGTQHKITKIIMHPGYHPKSFVDDLALLIIYRPIDFRCSPNKKISLYDGHVTPNIPAITSGWGCNGIKWFRDLHRYPKCLRSITVRIISLAECRTRYPHDLDITDKTICTFNGALEAKKHCSDGDSGGPLVLNDKLIGVMAWNREDAHANAPDVFMNLAHPAYRNWIISHMSQNSSNPIYPFSSCSHTTHRLPNPYYCLNPHHHPNPHQQPILCNHVIRRK